MSKYIYWIDEISKDDIEKVGGKGANLGELVNALIPVPDGFVVSSNAYFHFIKKNKIDRLIKKLLAHFDPENTKALNEISKHIKQKILETPFPADLAREIEESYFKFRTRDLDKNIYVAVRSSATAEDLPTASFAGQQATFLNVAGATSVVRAVKKAWASLFESRSIYYRTINKFNHLKVGIAVIVQRMVQSEKAGVLFTINPVNNNQEEIVIEAGFGLGEVVVSGSITPDRYVVNKKSKALILKEVNKQEWKISLMHGKDKHVRLLKEEKEKQKLTDSEIKKLTDLAFKIEKHYSSPQDTEWAIENGDIYFVQSRPVTTLAKKAPVEIKGEKAIPKTQAEILLKGIAASVGIAFGPVKIISRPAELVEVEKGDVLVAEMTNPSYVPAMKKAVAVVTDTGGLTSHAAIVSRELGIPAIVGTGQATHVLKDGQVVTADGTNGIVYKGKVAIIQKVAISELSETPHTATKIYVNLAEPELAAQYANLPADGVGLLRAEFMIAGIGYHPQYLIEKKRGREFTQKLSESIETIARAFHPRPVVYRATDFKTNEYKGLKGGEKFETKEENPMLGFRGALRYLKQPKVFDLELEALLNVRERLDLKNVWLMIPFVRTVEELEKIKKMVHRKGLHSSKTFRLWMMVEVPSNVFLIEDFCQAGIDGISFGSNDLTQLILGADRDNPILAETFDERNQAVIGAMQHVIEVTRKYGVTSSICGQAPSVYPEVVEELVKAKITSISAQPDAVIWVKKLVASVEKKLHREHLLKS